MLADDMACNPRNSYPGVIFNNANHKLDLYGDNIEVDYRGYEVNVENFIRLLTGRHDSRVPRAKQLLTDKNSNILIYMTGHGGDEFLKFQDNEEISSQDIADAFEQMHQKKRYNEILFIIDTCQANTLYKKFYSPNILSIGSSSYGENSYSHHADAEVGVAVIDRFTYYTLEFMENVHRNSNTTLLDLFRTYSYDRLGSNVGWSTDLYSRDISRVRTTEFFGAVVRVHLTRDSYPLERTTEKGSDIKSQEVIHNRDKQRSLNIVNEKNDTSIIGQQQEDLFNFDFVSKGVSFVAILLGLYYLYK
eukprot:TRINITY_DN2785_c0_g1_i3.p1 TRINITY_DN2785_c0_g1~~TRINITY_DN2785_c0_g1_i3.p1  ORF type:complete len:304 (-),score=47.17 TRINITY_DN2785_c0_g1_i3:20-931(-)